MRTIGGLSKNPNFSSDKGDISRVGTIAATKRREKAFGEEERECSKGCGKGEGPEDNDSKVSLLGGRA